MEAIMLKKINPVETTVWKELSAHHIIMKQKQMKRYVQRRH